MKAVVKLRSRDEEPQLMLDERIVQEVERCLAVDFRMPIDTVNEEYLVTVTIEIERLP